MHLSLLPSIIAPATYEKLGMCHIKSRNKRPKYEEVSICKPSVFKSARMTKTKHTADGNNYDKTTEIGQSFKNPKVGFGSLNRSYLCSGAS